MLLGRRTCRDGLLFSVSLGGGVGNMGEVSPILANPGRVDGG